MYLFELEFSLDICPRVGLLDHMVGNSMVGKFREDRGLCLCYIPSALSYACLVAGY